MTIKTPEQIATDAMDRHLDPENSGLYGPDLETTTEVVQTLIVSAIEADRAQRDLYELIAEQLDERASLEADDAEVASRAASEIRSDLHDDIWSSYVGPMLDELQEEFGTRRPLCDDCDERIEPDDIHAGDGMCGSCNHNAARSGA